MKPEPVTRGRDLNHVAWLYDPILEGLSFGRERKFREKTVQYIPLSAEMRILDVGCGTGSLTLAVARQMIPPGEIVGIDAAPKMIEIARRKSCEAAVKIDFQVGVSEALEFADDSFDLVVNSMFCHHIDTELKQRSFAEMYRVLRPVGTLVTADVDRPTTATGWLMGWGARYLLIQKELLDNLRGELPTLMEEAGFTDVQRCEQLYGLVSFFTASKAQEEP